MGGTDVPRGTSCFYHPEKGNIRIKKLKKKKTQIFLFLFRNKEPNHFDKRLKL